MKKIALALLTFLLFACSSDNGLIYSNLADEKSLNEVKEILLEKNIEIDDINQFVDDVNEYNDSVGRDNLSDGFISVKEIKYKDIDQIIDNYLNNNPEFVGKNCRITSFTLFHNMLDLSKASIGDIEYFEFDENSLNNKSNSFDKEEFFKFYSIIPTDVTTNVDVHIEKVKWYYKDNNIIFNNKNGVSIISMYFHDVIEESYLFVGHTGILLESGDWLYFIEKVSFQEPYQVIKFKNRNKLKKYLMDKYDVAFDGITAKPFIMENDKLLGN